MITYLDGRLIEAIPSRVVVATPGGVAYEVLIPVTTFELLPAVGESIILLTHLAVSEDSQTLYGFMQERTRFVFRLLINNVTGIGPKKALTILSSVDADSLVQMIANNELKSLGGISGVGPKLAERIVVDLRDKVEAPETVHPGKVKTTSPAIAEAIAALMALGFKSQEAKDAVKNASVSIGADATTEAIVKAALRKGKA